MPRATWRVWGATGATRELAYRGASRYALPALTYSTTGAAGAVGPTVAAHATVTAPRSLPQRLPSCCRAHLLQAAAYRCRIGLPARRSHRSSARRAARAFGVGVGCAFAVAILGVKSVVRAVAADGVGTGGHLRRRADPSGAYKVLNVHGAPLTVAVSI